jgi:predicted permease
MRLSTDIPVRFDFSSDWRVVAFTFSVALLAGLVAGLAPALQSARTSLAEVLREGGKSGTGGVRRQRIRNALVVVQIAVSLVLLISAGLFARSVRAATRVDLGFNPSNLVLMSLDPSMQRYDSVKTARYYEQIVRQARTLPGVQSVALARSVPLGYNNNGIEVYFNGEVQKAEHNHASVWYTTTTADYFKTMELPILKGRAFTEFDTDSTPQVAIVSAAMAQYFWPNQDVLGKRFRTSPTGPEIEIVGIAKDTKHVFLGESPRNFMYLPVRQSQPRDIILHVRTARDPAAMIPALRELLRQVDPQLTPFDVKTMQLHISGGIAFVIVRFAALLATAAGLLGLIQTIVGLYGVISYAVSQRTREIGIRMALGARGSDVVRGVVRQGMAMTTIGIVVGLLVAFGVTRAMAGFLVGVGATDLTTFVAATLILALLALLSSYLPARRAARMEPVVALRTE